MPEFMFRLRAEKRPMIFDTASDLADTFDTSLTATSIRLVDYGAYPAMLVCSDRRGVRWFCRGPEVPSVLRPQAAGSMTFANDLLKGSVGRSTSGHVYSDQWFSSVKRHSLHEDSRRISDELGLTLLWWENEDALIEIVACLVWQSAHSPASGVTSFAAHTALARAMENRATISCQLTVGSANSVASPPHSWQSRS
jgi:hypothetical protein